MFAARVSLAARVLFPLRGELAVVRGVFPLRGAFDAVRVVVVVRVLVTVVLVPRRLFPMEWPGLRVPRLI